MADMTKLGVTRRGVLGVFAATLAVAAPTYSNAFGLLRGAGDVRRIRMYSGRTGESIDTIYWIEGEYIPEVIKEINHFMRDWRSNDQIKYDLRTIDIMAAAHSLMDVSEPYMMLSGYRSPATNAMLRSKSGGVARNSLHMKGQAADLRLKSRSVGQMAKAAEACASGGVGRYSRSNFVHMDCGPVRHWTARRGGGEIRRISRTVWCRCCRMCCRVICVRCTNMWIGPALRCAWCWMPTGAR